MHTWRMRDTYIALGRAAVAVVAIVVLAVIGRPDDTFTPKPTPSKSPMIVRPATAEEQVLHDLEQAIR